MSETAVLLRQVPLLKGLPETDLTRLATATRRVSFGPAEDVVQIGDPGTSLFIVLDGAVRIIYPGRGADFELARLGAGEFFGEMALLNDKPRSATVRTVDHVEALVLEKEAFRSLVLETPVLALQLMEAMSSRIRNADEHISDLSDNAMRDPLTGLLNRRAFHERVTQEIARVRRYEAAFSVVLVDLDDLTAINETLGHDAGDELLRWVGRILLEHTRASDCPFRVGGEEFALLCPDTGVQKARAAARRLVEVVGEARPPVEGLRLTMSAGYATCPVHGATFEEVYGATDQALRRAKEAGRNRVGEPEHLAADQDGPGPDDDSSPPTSSTSTPPRTP